VLAFVPDVVHCFKPKAYAGLVAVALWAMQRTGVWRGQLIVDADDWEGDAGWNEVAGYSWPQQRFFAWQEQWGLRHCDGVTVASLWLEKQVASMRARLGRVSYVPNGVDRAANSRCRPKDERPSVLLYTRFTECDEAQVIDIWHRVVSELPTARLQVVGGGLRGEEQVLPSLADEEGVSDSIDIVGWVDKTRLPEVFGAAHLAMMPVQDTVLARAKCPSRLLDLMAAGVPVVAHAVGEYAKIVEDGVSGLLVPPGDHSNMASAMVALLEDEGRRRNMGKAARCRMLTAHDWERLVERVEKAYCRQS
jgi:glycosyltransferase involved in cell wall biosynthesis